MLAKIPVVAIASAADPAYPCGTALPGFGMAGGGAAGELLVGFTPPNPFLFAFGSPWSGPGSAAPVSLAVPGDCTLVGVELFAQGALVDPTPGASPAIGLTEGASLLIGP